MASAVLAQGTLRAIAKGLSVSPSTIHRWRKEGVPKERVSDLLRWGKKHHPKKPRGKKSDPRKTRKAKQPRLVLKALELPAGVLAVVGGVTRATAQKWKREGAIPLKSRGFLSSTTKAPKPRTKERGERVYKGRLTQGRFYTLDYGGSVEPHTLITISSWVATIRKSPSKKARYQISGWGKVTLDPKERLEGSARAKAVKGNRFDVVLPGLSEPTLEAALDSFLQELEAHDTQDLFLESVRVYVRIPL